MLEKDLCTQLNLVLLLVLLLSLLVVPVIFMIETKQDQWQLFDRLKCPCMDWDLLTRTREIFHFPDSQT